jgi:hypothetical protein
MPLFAPVISATRPDGGLCALRFAAGLIALV